MKDQKDPSHQLLGRLQVYPLLLPKDAKFSLSLEMAELTLR
jgi:hypothetical protein